MTIALVAEPPAPSRERAASRDLALRTIEAPSTVPLTPTAVAPAAPVEALTFESLYRDCARPIFNFVLRSVRDREDAEDICQEVWTSVHRRLPSIREAGAARVWLYRIARHAIIDAARRRGRTVPQGEMLQEPPAPPAFDPPRSLMAKEEAGFAWQALGALQPRQAMALYLREVEGRCYRDIAEVLDCSEAAIETLLFRARKRFAERYGCLAESRPSRCAQARRTLAVLLDSEGTTVERRALQAHVAECDGCRGALTGARQTTAARALVPFVPAPALALGGAAEALTALLEAGRALFVRISAVLTAKTAAVAGSAAVTALVAAAAIAPPADLPADLEAMRVPAEVAVAASVEAEPALTARATSADATVQVEASASAPDVTAATEADASVTIAPLEVRSVLDAPVASVLALAQTPVPAIEPAVRAVQEVARELTAATLPSIVALPAIPAPDVAPVLAPVTAVAPVVTPSALASGIDSVEAATAPVLAPVSPLLGTP